MLRSLHDRFLVVDGDAAWDVATGSRVRLPHILAPEETRTTDRTLGARIDWGATPDGGWFEAWEPNYRPVAAPRVSELETLLELLDHGFHMWHRDDEESCLTPRVAGVGCCRNSA